MIKGALSGKAGHLSGYNAGVERPEPAERPEIVFVHPDGRREAHSVAPGETVMDCALDNGVAGIVAQCGGGCTCSTCHCYVDEPWLALLPAMIDDERALLEYVWEWRHDSRLSCQIFVTPALDGIVVRLPERQQ